MHNENLNASTLISLIRSNRLVQSKGRSKVTNYLFSFEEITIKWLSIHKIILIIEMRKENEEKNDANYANVNDNFFYKMV